MVPVSEKAEVEGKCLEGKSEVIIMQTLLILLNWWWYDFSCSENWIFWIFYFSFQIFCLYFMQVRFVWHSKNSEEENLINLVVERNTQMPNLVYLRFTKAYQ